MESTSVVMTPIIIFAVIFISIFQSLSAVLFMMKMVMVLLTIVVAIMEKKTNYEDQCIGSHNFFAMYPQTPN